VYEVSKGVTGISIVAILILKIGIETRELKCTRDYLARNYTPIQLGENEFHF